MLVPPRYAQGIWTPSIQGSSTPGSYPTTSNQSKWSRIGNRVFLDIDITLSGASGGTGNILLKSLPYNKVDLYQTLGAVMVNGIDWTVTSDYLVLGWQGSSANDSLTIYEVQDNSGWTAIPISGVSSGDRIIGSISYLTDQLF